MTSGRGWDGIGDRACGEAKWLLVAGAPRSGTTFLGRLIGSHPNVALFTEGDLETIVANLRELLTKPVGGTIGVDTSTRGFNRFATAFFEARLDKRDLAFIGDKLPVSPEHARFYSELLGQALAQIYIVRAPSDVIASSLVRAATLDDPWHVTTVEEAIVEWARHYEQTAALLNQPNALIISYDRFKSDPDTSIGDLAAFLKVDPALFDRGLGGFIPKGTERTLSATASLLIRTIVGNIEHALLADLHTCLREHPAVYLPVASRTMLPVNASNTLMALCLKRGWGGLEEHGAWTIAAEAELAFQVDAAPGDTVTTTLSFVPFGEGPLSELVVAGRSHQARAQRPPDAGQIHEIAVRSIVPDNGVVSITLTIPKRKRMSDEPLHDTRELGVLLQGIAVA